MHEVSLVRNMFSLLEETYPGRLKDIRRIHLRAGLLSNVQPILMQNAFDAVLKDQAGLEAISLEVEITPIIVYCDDCKRNTIVENYIFTCSCGKPSKNIVQGDELLISQVDFAIE